MSAECPWCKGTGSQTANGATVACANCDGRGWRW